MTALHARAIAHRPDLTLPIREYARAWRAMPLWVRLYWRHERRVKLLALRILRRVQLATFPDVRFRLAARFLYLQSRRQPASRLKRSIARAICFPDKRAIFPADCRWSA